MGKVTRLVECKTEADFERVLTKYGIPVVNGGRHRCALLKGRRIPLGHAGTAPLPKGTRASILRSLAALGLSALLLAVWLAGYG